MGDIIRITDTLSGKWTITNKSKKIGKFMCFKALSNCKACTLFKEVWFAPELNSPFGPIGLGGLPGLIIEAKNKLSTITLNSISYNAKESIKKPKKGKLMTRADFLKSIEHFKSVFKED